MTQSGKRRIFECTTCKEQFSETRETVFFDLKTPEDKVMMALKMILVRVSLTHISFVLEVKAETVLRWLERATHKTHLQPIEIDATGHQLTCVATPVPMRGAVCGTPPTDIG